MSARNRDKTNASPATRPNFPSQQVFKVLNLGLLRGQAPFFSVTLIDVSNAVALCACLQTLLIETVSYRQFTDLLVDLYLWSEENGLPAEKRVPGVWQRYQVWLDTGDRKAMARRGPIIEHDEWWHWLCPQIDWLWIADQIKVELAAHAHDAAQRARDLEEEAPVPAYLSNRKPVETTSKKGPRQRR